MLCPLGHRVIPSTGQCYTMRIARRWPGGLSAVYVVGSCEEVEVVEREERCQEFSEDGAERDVPEEGEDDGEA